MNDIVGVEHIVDAVWGGAIPRTAANIVHTYIAGLRRVFEPGRRNRDASTVLVSAGGYALRAEPDAIDVELFSRHHARARHLAAEGNKPTALTEFDAALRLWRGEAYAGILGPFAEVVRARLAELRVAVVVGWAGTILAVGGPSPVVAALAKYVADEPLHERLRWLAGGSSPAHAWW